MVRADRGELTKLPGNAAFSSAMWLGVVHDQQRAGRSMLSVGTSIGPLTKVRGSSKGRGPKPRTHFKALAPVRSWDPYGPLGAATGGARGVISGMFDG